MTEHTFNTSTGPTTVTATEPTPGLHVYKIPADTTPPPTGPWVLAHHDGRVLATYHTSDAATTAAGKVAPLADWTRNAMTAAQEISLGGKVAALKAALHAE
ncbi:hypothetical protein QNO07_09535 [Streptomyces sp. 549]|uniref:hypothetical protein n=1 Tax=Streptomyces sp. 549 TaxID=3049076 RepID=UPI0024C3CA27|nr:hypothetical protein [Streptomyces sp. 549]MDK1473661.1 hypothetical protein [Streptomyces sp. 549]